MSTVITIEVLRAGAREADVSETIDNAFAWFDEVEAICTRFGDSELTRLTKQTGVPFEANPILIEVLRFAVDAAEETQGAFDPTMGAALYGDIEIDSKNGTITLHKPMSLDLGAVAKGLAVDAAARELAPFEDFAIDAGGDLYLGGRNSENAPWSVGIRHPRRDREVIRTVRVSNQAVCTSGDYERGNHIVDSRTGEPSIAVAGATVIAPSAMLADALGTAAFVLGPKEGIALMERLEVDGLIILPDLRSFETLGMRRYAA